MDSTICDICFKIIPSNNFFIHQLHCSKKDEAINRLLARSNALSEEPTIEERTTLKKRKFDDIVSISDDVVAVEATESASDTTVQDVNAENAPVVFNSQQTADLKEGVQQFDKRFSRIRQEYPSLSSFTCKQLQKQWQIVSKQEREATKIQNEQQSALEDFKEDFNKQFRDDSVMNMDKDLRCMGIKAILDSSIKERTSTLSIIALLEVYNITHEIRNVGFKYSIEWEKQCLDNNNEVSWTPIPLVLIIIHAEDFTQILFNKQLNDYYNQICDTFPKKQLCLMVEGIQKYLQCDKPLLNQETIYRAILWFQLGTCMCLQNLVYRRKKSICYRLSNAKVTGKDFL